MSTDKITLLKRELEAANNLSFEMKSKLAELHNRLDEKQKENLHKSLQMVSKNDNTKEELQVLRKENQRLTE